MGKRQLAEYKYHRADLGNRLQVSKNRWGMGLVRTDHWECEEECTDEAGLRRVPDKKYQSIDLNDLV